MSDKLTPIGVTLQSLEGSEGVFIGEYHTSSMAPDFLITHMEELVASGVTTIYMEMDHQFFTSGYVSRDCKQDYFGEWDAKFEADGVRSSNMNRDRENDYYDVIRTARENGIRVIGTENNYDTGENVSAFYDIAPDGNWVSTELGEEVKDLGTRDAFAAQVVNATRDGGKYIVYGGAHHSRQPGSLESDLEAGIDALLGIPSIDFLEQSDRRDRELAAHKESFGILAAYTTLPSAATERFKGLFGNESVVEQLGDGSASYTVTNRGGYRYPERDTSITDNRDELPPMSVHLTEAAASAMIEAGVCEAPEDTVYRGDGGLEELVGMVAAQYETNDVGAEEDFSGKHTSAPTMANHQFHIEK